MNEQLVLALDVGGSSVKSALVAKAQQVVGEVRADQIQSEASAPQILDRLAGIISSHLEQASSLHRIAFAFPGPFDYEQGIPLIKNQSKYDALYGLRMGEKLRELLRLPGLEMRYRDDAEAAILGEALYGAGVPYTRLLGVTLGTRLGSAFVADGEVVRVGDNIPPQGWLYPLLFKNQRADDVFSTRGLLARLQRHGIHATDIFSTLQRAEKDQAALADAFVSFGVDLGNFLNPFVSDFRAEAVLLSGGIAGAWERFIPALSRSLSVPVVKGMLGTAPLFLAPLLFISNESRTRLWSFYGPLSQTN